MGGVGSGRTRRSARADQRCSKCGELGHRRDKCGIEPKAYPPAPPRRSTPAAIAGADFIVIETVIDEGIGPVLIGDEVWTAIAPTGRTFDGAAEWTMRRAGIEHLGYPELYPFLRRPPAGASMNVPRIGMQLRVEPKAEPAPEPEPPEFDPAAARRANPLGFRRPKEVIDPATCLLYARTKRLCSSCRRAGDLDSFSDRAA